LTWDDEVRLSDILHEARQAKSRAKDGKPATEKDAAAIKAGEEAADELVVAHSGLAKRIAGEVSFNSRVSGSVDFEDLVQVGVLGLYSCANSFDARKRSDGVAHDTGQRFSMYSRLYLMREMYRAVKRGEADLTGSIATKERTQEWLKSKDRLREEMGRPPKPAEVSEYCGIPLSSIDLHLVGKSPVLGQPIHGAGDGGEDSDMPVLDGREPERTGEVDDALMSAEYAFALESVLSDVLRPHEAEAFSLWMAFDRGAPRSIVEVAKEMDVKVAEAGEYVAYAVARLRHPQNVHRVQTLAVRALNEIESTQRVPIAS
jgi:DNA-directed RNA polymerase specialized sigma subunit